MKLKACGAEKAIHIGKKRLIPVKGDKFHFHLDQQHIWQQAASMAEHIELSTLYVDSDEVNILDLMQVVQPHGFNQPLANGLHHLLQHLKLKQERCVLRQEEACDWPVQLMKVPHLSRANKIRQDAMLIPIDLKQPGSGLIVWFESCDCCSASLQQRLIGGLLHEGSTNIQHMNSLSLRQDVEQIQVAHLQA